ncbi:MAG: radical SAM protein, partial [Methanosarcinales archaeon]|nr:radical SAM protein [Methanosarcinales archaeon]
VKGVNDHEAPQIASLVEEIGPDRVQLNTVVRPPSEPVEPLSQDGMLDMLDIFQDAEVIPDWNWHVPRDMEQEIVSLLQENPCTVVEIGEQTGLDMRDVMKYVKILEREERVKRQSQEGKLLFYV